MSSIMQAGKDLLNTYANASVAQGVAYAGTSCLNSYGYLPEFAPLPAAATAALLVGISGVLDLARKQISYFNETTELFEVLDEKRENYRKEVELNNKTEKEYGVGFVKNLEPLKQEIGLINKELKLYRLVRSVIAVTLTVITISFKYNAINSLPSMVNALAASSAVPIALTTLGVAQIFIIGLALKFYMDSIERKKSAR